MARISQPRPIRVRRDRWTAGAVLFLLTLLSRLIALGSLPATLVGPELSPLQSAWLGAGSGLPGGFETLLLAISQGIFGPT
ncbi:MAG TPA: hypothetical protein VHL09_02380, partial [Dehalococcoidia bacterium]|nr:hypothetical protein [Dehalococcoidia bacterium]